jgi:hypothetical protein
MSLLMLSGTSVGFIPSRRKGEDFAMKSKSLWAIAAVVLVFSVSGCGSSSSSSSTSQASLSPAAKVCSEVAVTGDEAIATCAEGYKAATAHGTVAGTCALGDGGIKTVEDQRDCKAGFIVAGGVTQTAPSPSAAAVSECESITRGASDGSPAACEQGYQGALAGDSQEASCYHLGAGAITTFEYVTSCEAGWFVAKGEPACTPGSDPKNGQPGSTIKSDAATDKTCSTPS